MDHRYYPETTKNILVVAYRNVPQAKEYFRGMGITVVTGSRYLGRFVGGREAEARWIKEKVKGWAESIQTLGWVARKHPHYAFAGLQKSLQQEWEFMQRFTPEIGDAFGPVEEEIKTAFVLELFHGVGDGAPGREITPCQ